MKIQLYRHSSVKANIDDDIIKVLSYFKSDFVRQFLNIDITIDKETTNVPKQEVLSKLVIPSKDDIVMYVFERGVFQTSAWGYTLSMGKERQYIYLVCDKPSDDIDYTWKAMVHEILHAITYKLLADRNIPFTAEWNLLDNYYMNNDPYFVGGNHYQQLQKISTLKYKYFKESEVVGLKPDFVRLLDKMRGECGFPFIINSGYRTKDHNEEVGGVENSAHTEGLAVDINCKESAKRYKLIKVALDNGIERIGIAKTFIHLDTSQKLPKGVVWLYD